jgi:hypothetical protein
MIPTHPLSAGMIIEMGSKFVQEDILRCGGREV